MMLGRLIAWCHDHRLRVLVLWAVALVVIAGAAGAAGGETETDYSVPGSDSADAVQVLTDRFPSFAGDSATIVYSDDRGVEDPAVQAQIDGLRRDLGTIDHVVATVPGPAAADGHTALLEVRFDGAGEQIPVESIEAVLDLADHAQSNHLRTEVGGYPVQIVEAQDAGSESAGLLAAVVILLIAFGSVLAAGLPLVVAGFGLGVGLSAVWLAANVLAIPDVAIQLATMIGIGVGIDYALFMVTRVRSALAAGLAPRDAVVTGGTAAARAVLFAGCTVIVSIFGLGLMGRAYLWGVAIATSLAVLGVLISAVTVLPALLGFAGASIDRFRLPWFRHDDPSRRTVLRRWSHVMQRRPLIAGLGALVALSVLIIPVKDLRFGMPDAGNGSTDLSSRRAYDLMQVEFGIGSTGPLLVAVDLHADTTARAVSTGSMAVFDRIARDLSSTDGVASVAPVVVNDAGDAAVVTVIPATGPQDEATERLVRHLRDDVLPDAVRGTGAEASVGGTTATFIDENEYTGSRLPLFIGVVVVLSVLLLMTVFRSVAVAIKAAVMNVLSIGAAYGIMASAASGGVIGGLVGIESSTPVPAWLPMLMFAVLFGLSMDYEVFLLTRVREEYERTGDNANAVADGLAATGRVITAAAAIMVTVFGAYVMEDSVFLKLAGVGLATAVFVDATVVRMVLVPSTMELLGDRNWWLPGWLDRLLPNLQVEAAEPPVLAAEAGSLAFERAPQGRGEVQPVADLRPVSSD